MAEEDEELLGPMDELGEDEEDEEDQEEGSPLMRYLPLIAVVLVVQIILVYVTVTFFLGPSEPPPEAEQEVVEEEAPPPEEEAPDLGELEVAIVYEALESIVVNPAGTEGLRFLSAKIHLGLSSAQVEQTIEEKKLGSKIRDGLIDILRAKTIAELDPEYHEVLKTQIKDKLNEILVGKDSNAAPAVVEVYFQTFVLQ